ncbi:MAG: tetratricopeptide repeat protein [Magnetococcales bacterium]|nr:tetratricopeptide repeat protein [Magnetococcales bacterium]
MNRAERRRQQKISKKATCNKSQQPPDTDQKQLSVDEAYTQALENFNAAQYTEADQLCTAIIQVFPKHTYAINLRGLIAQRDNLHDLAVELFQKAINIDSSIALFYYNLGTSLYPLGRIVDVVKAQKKALSIQPIYPEALSSLGCALIDLGRLDEAVLCLQESISIKPDFAYAYSNLGNALKGLGQFEEAVTSFRKAISIKPDYVEAHYNLGLSLYEQGQFEEAVTSYQKAISIKPDYADVYSRLIYCIDIFSNVNTNLFQIVRQRWNRQFAEHSKYDWQPLLNKPDPNKKIRIGYVGAYFKNHSAANMFGPVILNQDLNKFEIICYVGNQDEDGMTREIKKKSTKWLHTLQLSDVALGEQIRSDGIDILVDLAGHMYGSRLLAYIRKPAPILITAWGYPFGTGMEAMDYIFADPISIPFSDRHMYTEQIVDLSCMAHFNSYTHFPDVKNPPVCDNGYITFGAFNRLEKYNTNVYELWAELLNLVPDAKLLLKEKNFVFPEITRKIEAVFQNHGISKNRLIFMGNTPHIEHLEAHNQIDIMLDPFPQNGGMTTLESLRMGVPVLTCENKIRLRTSASILHILELDVWRAKDENEYIEKAVHFSNDIQYLKTLRHQLRNRFDESNLGNSQLYTQEIEKIYRQLWIKWCDSMQKTSPTASA